jgi:hypothetical protein
MVDGPDGHAGDAFGVRIVASSRGQQHAIELGRVRLPGACRRCGGVAPCRVFLLMPGAVAPDVTERELIAGCRSVVEAAIGWWPGRAVPASSAQRRRT